MWYGRDAEYTTDGLPHVTKIKGKPRGVGAEMKAACDGESNIMLQLEIMEGAERQKLKKYHTDCGSGTSITMRLCDPWKGTGRTVIADSAFSSVKTLQSLHEELGLFFIGMVKSASTGYPATYLADWYASGWDPNPRREPGSWKTLQVNHLSVCHISIYEFSRSIINNTNAFLLYNIVDICHRKTTTSYVRSRLARLQIEDNRFQ